MKSQTNNCHGSALLLSLISTGVISLALGSYLFLISGQYRATVRSQRWNASIPIAEAGIEDAIAHLNRNFNTNSINHLTADPTTGGWTWVDVDRLEKVNYFKDGSHYIVTIECPTSLYPEVYTQGYANHFALNGSRAMFATLAPGGVDPNISPKQQFLRRNVRVVTRRTPVFDHAIAADGVIDFNGIVETDSFDSRNPNRSNAGQYDPAKRGYKGDVATNMELENALNLSNAKIRGRVSTGPESTTETLQIGPNGSVGDTTHVDTGNTGVQEGFYDNDMNVDFVEVEPPFVGGTPRTQVAKIEEEVTSVPKISTCDCVSYATSPCCVPALGPNGEVGVVTVMTEAVTTENAPAYGSYVGALTTQWTTVRNSDTPPSGTSRNLTYRTRNTTSDTYPPAGTYVGDVSTSVNKKGETSYHYNEITAYNYEEVGSYSYALIKGYQRDYSVYVTNQVTVIYDYVFDSGRYSVGSLSGKVLVEGKAEVYCTGDINLSGTKDGIWIRPGASLKLYSSGANTTITGQGVVNEAGLAENFSYFGLPSNKNVSIKGNGKFIGTIYAPQAALQLSGGGSDVEDFIGAVVADTVKMNGKFQFHYDEALAEFGPTRGFRITRWIEE